ncbi:MAG: cytochrome c biogenesis protein CcsA [Proteobacteria bacterium]|nr:cytochrome c biogenesis protein CcsA [Pseudomonadota bacterium]MBU1743038.1 cytochrome c biogenesis protein CcsA [Pseudomonadota bacterium]
MSELIGLLLNVVTLTYLVAWTGYVVASIFRRVRLVGPAADVVLWLTIALHVLALVLLWTQVELAPLTNKYQFLVFFAAAVGLGSAILIGVTRRRVLAVFTVPFAFLAMAYASWSPFVSDKIGLMMPALKSFWLIAHVITSFLGYAGFAVACGLALAYLFRWTRDHRPEWYDWLIGGALVLVAVLIWLAFDWSGTYWRGVSLRLLIPWPVAVPGFKLFVRSESLPLALIVFALIPVGLMILCQFLPGRAGGGEEAAGGGGGSSRLPSAEALHHYTYQFMVFGLILFTAGIATGAIWADKAWSRYWGWDPKETWSLITWFLYVLFPHLSRLKWLKGSYLAWVAIVGFFSVLITWFVVNQLGGIHAYGA